MELKSSLSLQITCLHLTDFPFVFCRDHVSSFSRIPFPTTFGDRRHVIEFRPFVEITCLQLVELLPSVKITCVFSRTPNTRGGHMSSFSTIPSIDCGDPMSSSDRF